MCAGEESANGVAKPWAAIPLWRDIEEALGRGDVEDSQAPSLAQKLMAAALQAPILPAQQQQVLTPPCIF